MSNDRYEEIRKALAMGPTPGPILNEGETPRGVMLLAGLEDRKATIYLYGPEHISSPDCWCEPELDYKDPDTGAEVWVHRELQ
jgi:hypothetical protein